MSRSGIARTRCRRMVNGRKEKREFTKNIIYPLRKPLKRTNSLM